MLQVPSDHVATSTMSPEMLKSAQFSHLWNPYLINIPVSWLAKAMYPPVIKHGVLEKGPFIGDVSVETSSHRGFSSRSCLITRGQYLSFLGLPTAFSSATECTFHHRFGRRRLGRAEDLTLIISNRPPFTIIYSLAHTHNLLHTCPCSGSKRPHSRTSLSICTTLLVAHPDCHHKGRCPWRQETPRLVKIKSIKTKPHPIHPE